MNELPALMTVVLAAGHGKRMRSPLPKVLHPLRGRPMIEHVLDLAESLDSAGVVVVVGYGKEQVEKALRHRSVTLVTQEPQVGTAHAVLQTWPLLQKHEGPLFVLAGDSPLLTVSTLRRMLKVHVARSAAVTVLVARTDNPTGCGRIVLNASGELLRIVEENDATEKEKEICLVNTSTYVFDAKKLFKALQKVGNENAQGEYYLTDAIEILRQEDERLEAVLAASFEETLGVNTKQHLDQAEQILVQRSAHR